MPAPVGNNYAEGNNGGRPSKYKEEYAEQAYKLCLLGATTEELAQFFDVNKDTITEWMNTNEVFSVSVKEGRTIADMEVAKTAYDKAKGFSYTEQQAIKVKTGQYTEEVQVVDVQKYCVPDSLSIKFWLVNRRNNWRERQSLEIDFDNMPEAHLDAIIERLIQKSNGQSR